MMRTGSIVAALALVFAAALALPPSAAQAQAQAQARPQTQAGSPLDCFELLSRGRSEMIECTLPLNPSAAEQAELDKQTRGYVKNAQCTVTIKIARADIMAAVQQPDHVFVARPQPVQCLVTGQLSKEIKTLPISATFAPRIVIKGGKAVDAVPGLGNVKGVPRAISWPVEAVVNSGIGFKGNMLVVINAWLEHMRRTQTGQVQRL